LMLNGDLCGKLEIDQRKHLIIFLRWFPKISQIGNKKWISGDSKCLMLFLKSQRWQQLD
jgi:hypothetical protein